MTVVPLFCAKFIRLDTSTRTSTRRSTQAELLQRASIDQFNEQFQRYAELVRRLWLCECCSGPASPPRRSLGGVALILLVTVPFLGRAYFPRTDPGQFVIDVRMPSGTRLEVSNDYIAKVEEHHPQRGQAQRSGHDRLQHRRLSRSFGDLHHQCVDGHGLCADQPEGRPQHRQL